MAEFFFDALAFIIIFGSILFLAYVTTRYIGGKAGRAMKGKYVKVVESVSLGMDKQIHVIKAGEQYLLIATAGKSVTFLTDIQIEDDGISKDTPSPNVFDFKPFIEKYLQAFKGKKETKSDNNTANKADELQNIPNRPEGDVFRNNLNKLKSITSRVKSSDNKYGEGNSNEE